MPYTQYSSSRGREHVSSVRLFVGDAIIAFRLLDEVRHRIMAAVFGTSRNDSNLVMLFVIAAFGAAFRRAAAAPRTQVRKVRSSPTAVGDTMIGAAVARETLDSIAGHRAKKTSFGAGLIVFALVVHSLRPAIERSLHAAWQSFHELAAAAHRARSVMRRWGVSNLPEPLAQTLRPGNVGDEPAPRGPIATG